MRPKCVGCVECRDILYLCHSLECDYFELYAEDSRHRSCVHNVLGECENVKCHAAFRRQRRKRAKA